MYSTLLVFHSWFRWLVLLALTFSIYRAYIGYSKQKIFSKQDDSLRHWTATIAHVQLMIGMILYFKSPIVSYFWNHFKEALNDWNTSFFGLFHFSLMVLSVVVLTIGSAWTKRKTTDRAKYKTMLYWFSLALLIIIIAIPWPFSPLASRTYLRTF